MAARERPVRHEPDDELEHGETSGRPSKSARKRAAQEAQDLGVQLVQLREAQLAQLELPEPLREAIRAARSITSRAASARHRQYIGKLMRDIDTEPIRAALGARSQVDAQETERFRRVESWRDRLISEGAAALQELTSWHPQIDPAEWARRVSAAQAERARTGVSGAASRELFRALRALFATMP
jgi:ribosome-associated protein